MNNKRGWHTRQRNRVKRSAGNEAEQVAKRQEGATGSLSVLSETAVVKTGAGKIVPLFSQTLYRARAIDPL